MKLEVWHYWLFSLDHLLTIFCKYITIPVYQFISFHFSSLYEEITSMCMYLWLSILITSSVKAETLITLMQSGKELLSPFNTNALWMAFTADLQNAELKHVRTADTVLIEKRSNLYRVTYVAAESLSNCLHAGLFIVLKSEPIVLVSDPYLG